MKSKLIFISVLLFPLYASTQLFYKDTVHLGFGAGIGWPYEYNKTLYSHTSALPSFNFEIERGFFNYDSIFTFSLGLRGTYKYVASNKPNSKAYWHNIVVGPVAKLYFVYFNHKGYIPYVGIMGGVNAITFKDNAFLNSNFYPIDYNGVYPLLYGFIGAKYQSSPKFGIFGEASWGFAYATLGVYLNL